MTLMVAVAYGCGGDAFEGADGGGSGKTSGTAGKSTGSGGKSSTQPGAGGDDGEPGSAGEDQGAGGDSGGSAGSGTGGKAPLGGQGGGTLGGAMMGGGVNGGTGGSGGVINPDGPLLLIDLLGMDTGNLTGFNAAGFRCKSLTVCGVAQTCVYHTGFLGSMQSQDPPYSDGDELDQPQAVKLRIAGGAKSDCTGAEFKTTKGELLKLTYNSAAGQQSLLVAVPDFSGTELVLYVRADGSTFYDAALMQLAASPP